MKRPRDRDGERRYVVPERIAGSLSAERARICLPGGTPDSRHPQIDPEPACRPTPGLVGAHWQRQKHLAALAGGLVHTTGWPGLDRRGGPAAARTSRNSQPPGLCGPGSPAFQGSLRDNLVLSDSWISDARVIEVLQKLDMYTMVASHPRGLDMPLTEAGGGLSGGQRQMLAIARMMLRDPALVFLDEPTSMMDQTTEAKVIEVLGQWLQGRTLVLSTHRLQLLVWVERIALMENGQILLEGPREEVLRKLAVGVTPKAAAGTRTRAPSKSNTTAAAPVSHTHTHCTHRTCSSLRARGIPMSIFKKIPSSFRSRAAPASKTTNANQPLFGLDAGHGAGGGVAVGGQLRSGRNHTRHWQSHFPPAVSR
ncbi:hypothetical protein GHT06_007455 [Daphnia sinensis]|uniref:ABC transporter domain-containing protein n=1 Tax=Daphnia sinensis TaxID=1820382 RepID=A0AAD5PNP1_9CRUS|nr:hypothetical protein GHT06_007455 [Daphnia sinensis]